MASITHILVASGFMAALGIALAGLLAIANRKLYVYEDPRIDEVEEMLPSANCGACGTAGCRPFAESLIDGKVEPSQCTVNAVEMNEAIAEFLGVDAGHQIKRVARLACAGGDHVAYQRANYAGLSSCRAAALVSGGGKTCTWGCLGLADCKVVCDFDAISMDRHGLPVVDEDKCTACGDCVDVCPKDLFSLQPINHRLWVACKNQEFGDKAEDKCEVACNACGRCAADAPEGLIAMQNNLATVDYSKNELATRIPIERCPTGAIVWFEKEDIAVKGVGAKPIIRQKSLPVKEAKEIA